MKTFIKVMRIDEGMGRRAVKKERVIEWVLSRAFYRPFTRQELLKYCKNNRISESTMERALTELTMQKLLVRLPRGRYALKGYEAAPYSPKIGDRIVVHIEYVDEYLRRGWRPVDEKDTYRVLEYRGLSRRILDCE